MSGHGLLKALRRDLPPTFESLHKPFAAVATNISDGQTTVLGQGDLPKAVLASVSVPPVFRPVEINNKLYVDGGLKANLPVNIARTLGATTVVAVLGDTSIKHKPNCQFKSLAGVVGRVTEIMLAANDKIQANQADVLIYPDTDFVPAVTKNKEIIERAIRNGELAARFFHSADQQLPRRRADEKIF